MSRRLKTAPVIPVNEFQGSAQRLLGLFNEVERRYAPEFLFGAGRRELLERLPLVSVVGTRSPSREAACGKMRRTSSSAMASGKRSETV